MNYLLRLLPVLSLVFIFTSCISQKKYQAALDREQNLMARNTELANEVTRLNSQIQSLQTDNAKLVKQIDDAMKQAADASGVANMTQKQLEAEQKRLWDLRRLLDQQRQAVENLRKLQ
jgi:chemotaxis protein MotB